jgi:hypothetical protein
MKMLQQYFPTQLVYLNTLHATYVKETLHNFHSPLFVFADFLHNLYYVIPN